MKKFFKWTIIVIVGLFILGVVFGESDTNEVETASVNNEPEVKKEGKKEDEKEEVKEKVEEFGVGQEVSVESLSYTVNGTEEKNELKMEYMDSLKTEGKFIIVDITVKNNDKEARFIDGEMFRLVDTDGVEFSAKSEADMYINKSDLGFFLAEVNPKMSKTGKIAFEVPADANDLKLQVSSGFGWSGGEYKVIDLK